MGAGGRLRVVLNTKSRHLKAAQAFDNIVIKADMAYFGGPERRLEWPTARGCHGEPMVVRGYAHSTGAQILNWRVNTAMAVA